MFKVRETIKTSTGEEVKVLRFLSARKDFSKYIVCIDQDIFIMKWFDKELYKGHFNVIERICKENGLKSLFYRQRCFGLRIKRSMDFVI